MELPDTYLEYMEANPAKRLPEFAVKKVKNHALLWPLRECLNYCPKSFDIHFYSVRSCHHSWKRLAQYEHRMHCNIIFSKHYIDTEPMLYFASSWRFQWVIKRKLAVMAWPQYPEHLRFLLKIGIRRLVSLTPECRPPIHMFT